MINLEGKEDCDAYIIHELIDARIDAISLPISSHPEVKSLYEGQLLGWKFRRQWYYWSASCEDPFKYGLDLKYASPLHALIGKEVRLAGHCGCPSPDDGFWMDKFDEKGNELISQAEMNKCKKDAERSDLMKQTYERLLAQYRPVEDKLAYAREKGKLVASSYHIDSQIGLDMFCVVLRKQAEDVAAAELERKELTEKQGYALKRLGILDYFKIKQENPNDIFTCPRDKTHGRMEVRKDMYKEYVIGFSIHCPTCEAYHWWGSDEVNKVVKIYESRHKD